MVAGKYQPRTRIDEGALYELAESIKAQGIMQPILVRKLTQGPHAGKYEIIAGERRFRASKLAGLDHVPVLVRDVKDEAAAGCRGVDGFGQGAKSHTTRFQSGDNLDQMRQGTAQPIQSPNPKDITFTQECQCRRQAGPLRCRTGNRVLK